ncbi:DUF3298 and DUF4163 domain-containing protein [Hymenobacter pini]|uniref:DUF3298 and DUF4163 domain-containing protein n=1 Tax=Hymenobacter pini TaxID=2880879 RepID=UPI001CF21431|nr:DUF3298 and DUF4163 domain-containing protein [Hymenobacter pini]MCA8831246.1 DUF3298 and DUF4163 domain-containing protein [Hymenobacter pini]
MSFLFQTPVRRLLYALPAPLAAGLLLAACTSNSDKSAAQTEAASETTTTSPTATANTPTDTPPWYRQYRTLLPGTSDSVTVHLQNLGDAPGETTMGRLVGFYAAADGHPYELAGDQPTGTDSLNLRDISREQATGSSEGTEWRLKKDGAAYAGTLNGQPVRLRWLRTPTGVEFTAKSFSENVLPRPEHPEDSVAAHFSMFALVPASGPAKDKLAASIVRGLRGDTVETKAAPSLETLWKDQLAYFTKEYRKEVAPLMADMAKDTSDYRPRASLAYEQEANSYILWNEGSLLSIGYFGYDYSGGAHGMYGTYVRSYDTRTGRALRYEDIFRPGTKPQLEGILGRYARPALGLKDAEPLKNALFQNSLPATRNVYLTGGGAVFVYLPYEVASYAQGEISVFVPYSALQPVLKPGLPIGGGTVASR